MSKFKNGIDPETQRRIEGDRQWGETTEQLAALREAVRELSANIVEHRDLCTVTSRSAIQWCVEKLDGLMAKHEIKPKEE